MPLQHFLFLIPTNGVDFLSQTFKRIQWVSGVLDDNQKNSAFNQQKSHQRLASTERGSDGGIGNSETDRNNSSSHTWPSEPVETKLNFDFGVHLQHPLVVLLTTNIICSVIKSTASQNLRCSSLFTMALCLLGLEEPRCKTNVLAPIEWSHVGLMSQCNFQPPQQYGKEAAQKTCVFGQFDTAWQLIRGSSHNQSSSNTPDNSPGFVVAAVSLKFRVWRITSNEGMCWDIGKMHPDPPKLTCWPFKLGWPDTPQRTCWIFRKFSCSSSPGVANLRTNIWPAVEEILRTAVFSPLTFYRGQPLSFTHWQWNSQFSVGCVLLHCTRKRPNRKSFGKNTSTSSDANTQQKTNLPPFQPFWSFQERSGGILNICQIWEKYCGGCRGWLRRQQPLDKVVPMNYGRVGARGGRRVLLSVPPELTFWGRINKYKTFRANFERHKNELTWKTSGSLKRIKLNRSNLSDRILHEEQRYNHRLSRVFLVSFSRLFCVLPDTVEQRLSVTPFSFGL